MNQRFQMNANSFSEAKEYIINRAIQLLAEDYKLMSIAPQENWGVKAIFRDKVGQNFQSIYVLNDHRGQDHIRRYIKAGGLDMQFITSPDCNLENFFVRSRIPYQVAGWQMSRKEYRAIAIFYGYARAERSNVPFMNHIDEGLAILDRIKASDTAKMAYCLHPLFQEDADLAANFSKMKEVTDNVQVLALALEYRNIANAYLSNRQIDSIDDINLGPLPEVRDMLIADKVQNYKDFIQYHRRTHQRSIQLTMYFENWLKKLNISHEQFETWSRMLMVEPSILS